MTAPVLHIDIPARYRIRVQGYPVGNWFERLDDLTIVRTTRMGQAPVVTLSGCVVDQRALIDLLDDLLDQGVELLSVKYLDTSTVDLLPDRGQPGVRDRGP